MGFSLQCRHSKIAHLGATFFLSKSRCHTYIGKRKNFSLGELTSLRCRLQVKGKKPRRSLQDWVAKVYICIWRHKYTNTQSWAYNPFLLKRVLSFDLLIKGPVPILFSHIKKSTISTLVLDNYKMVLVLNI